MLHLADATKHNVEVGNWLDRAVDLDEEAIEHVIVQLGSAHSALQEIIKQEIYNTLDAELWRHLLDCVALRRWNPHALDPHHLLTEHTTLRRVEQSISDLFVHDQPRAAHQPATVTPIKLMVLREGLQNKQADVRYWAAILLDQRGERNETITNTLIEAARDDTSACFARAVRTLGHVPSAHGAQVLVDVLAHHDESVRLEAAQSLVDMGSVAVPALTRALQAPDREVRRQAAHALTKIADERATTALVAALGDEDSGVSWAAGEGLAAIGAPALPAIIEWLTRHPLSHHACRSAYHALRQMPMETQEMLVPVLDALRGQAAETSAPTAAFHFLHNAKL